MVGGNDAVTRAGCAGVPRESSCRRPLPAAFPGADADAWTDDSQKATVALGARGISVETPSSASAVAACTAVGVCSREKKMLPLAASGRGATGRGRTARITLSLCLLLAAVLHVVASASAGIVRLFSSLSWPYELLRVASTVCNHDGRNLIITPLMNAIAAMSKAIIKKLHSVTSFSSGMEAVKPSQAVIGTYPEPTVALLPLASSVAPTSTTMSRAIIGLILAPDRVRRRRFRMKVAFVCYEQGIIPNYTVSILQYLSYTPV